MTSKAKISAKQRELEPTADIVDDRTKVTCPMSDGPPKNWFICLFHQFAKIASRFAGHPVAFCLAVGVVAVWAISGPIFEYSDTWQLVINTSTTIITFLMVFLIQSTQNRDMTATQIKLDELIRALDSAKNSMLDLEELEEEDLEKLRQKYEELAKRSRD